MQDKPLDPPVLSLEDIADRLCREESYEGVYHRPLHDQPMPSAAVLAEIMERLQALLFPGFFGDSGVTPETMRFHVGAGLDVVFRLLSEQIKRGHCFSCTLPDPESHQANCWECEDVARRKTERFLSRLPAVRRLLAGDVRAAFLGDPAAKLPGETIFCYPSILALAHQRLAHELHRLDVELIPRIITEMAHSKTGIDIHPGASIGEQFFIDHGTGVVIGETSVIGANVRVYQGVTLGAKSFPKDASGALIKGAPRHPIIEDDVVIYAGATILGRVTIGKGSVIGGNVWCMEDVPPFTQLVQSPAGVTMKKLLGNGG